MLAGVIKLSKDFTPPILQEIKWKCCGKTRGNSVKGQKCGKLSDYFHWFKRLFWEFVKELPGKLQENYFQYGCGNCGKDSFCSKEYYTFSSRKITSKRKILPAIFATQQRKWKFPENQRREERKSVEICATCKAFPVLRFWMIRQTGGKLGASQITNPPTDHALDNHLPPPAEKKITFRQMQKKNCISHRQTIVVLDAFYKGNLVWILFRLKTHVSRFNRSLSWSTTLNEIKDFSIEINYNQLCSKLKISY